HMCTAPRLVWPHVVRADDRAGLLGDICLGRRLEPQLAGRLFRGALIVGEDIPRGRDVLKHRPDRRPVGIGRCADRAFHSLSAGHSVSRTTRKAISLLSGGAVMEVATPFDSISCDEIGLPERASIQSVRYFPWGSSRETSPPAGV